MSEQSNNNSSNNKRIAKNTIYLYIRMFFALIINLYTSRVLLNALGVEDYGVYNVVAGFVSLFAFMNATLSSSVQRFYNYEVTQKGAEGFKNIYVTALMTHAVIAVCLLPLLETFGLWYVNNILVVPSGMLFAANVLFQMSSFSMILMMMQIPYMGAVMAKEHMDFYAVVSIADVLLKLFIALAVAYTDYDNLILYGILLALVSVFDFLMYFTYTRRKFAEMKLKRYFDKTIFRSMLAFSGWNLLGTFAYMSKGQGLNMLLNFFFGPIINAARGVAFQVNGAISGFTASIYTAFAPQVVSSYARGDTSRTVNMLFLESKVCFLLIAIIVTPVILEMDLLLHLWLGDIVPEYTSLFSALVLIDLLVCTLNTPCTQVVQATGKIKHYQIGATIVNLSIIPICWCLLSIGFSATTVFIATIVFSIINQIVCLYFTNRALGFGVAKYCGGVVMPCILVSMVIPIVPLLICYIMNDSFTRLLFVGFASMIAGLGSGLFIILRKSERDTIITVIKSKLYRKYA